MVMVRAPMSPKHVDAEDKRRPRRGPAAVAVTGLLTAGVVLFLAGTTRWRVKSNSNHFNDDSVVVSKALPGPLSVSASSFSWIPRMEPGMVAAKQGEVPDWYQCWAPLCEQCEVPSATGTPLDGLRIYVLSHGGPQERAMRNSIRRTWGHRATDLGAAVTFVLGDTTEQWGTHEQTAIQHESSMHSDILLVKIHNYQGEPVEDSYIHLAYKINSLAALALPQMQQSEWFMKVDSDTYVNADRLAVDITKYREIAGSGGGSWQYGGYHNNGKVQVLSDPNKMKHKKQLAWLEIEFGKTHEFYPAYAFGAAGWLLGYDALAFLVGRASDPAVARPKSNEDAMIGALLETCTSCTRERWQMCEILGGTSFPFAPLKPQNGCPSLYQRIGMAVADGDLEKFKCLITVSELKEPEYMQGMHYLVTKGRIPPDLYS